MSGHQPPMIRISHNGSHSSQGNGLTQTYQSEDPWTCSSSSHLLGWGGRGEGGPVRPGPRPNVLTPTFFNEGHGIQLLRVFVTLLQLSPWRRNSSEGPSPSQKPHILPDQGLQPDGKKPILPHKLLVLRITRRTFQWVIPMCPFFLHLLPVEELGPLRGIQPPFLWTLYSKVQCRVPMPTS